MYGQMYGRMDEWMDNQSVQVSNPSTIGIMVHLKQSDGWMDGWKDEPTVIHRQSDRPVVILSAQHQFM